ncbi:MAG: DprA-like winged helix domain-containing protein, partial [Planctomycetota bacterium]
HRLLKEGAKLVESVEDVMEALGYVGKRLQTHATAAADKARQQIDTPLFAASELNLSDREKKIYDSLSKDPLHVDQIISATNMAPGAINAGLISLRLKGLIKQLPGGSFARN